MGAVACPYRLRRWFIARWLYESEGAFVIGGFVGGQIGIVAQSYPAYGWHFSARPQLKRSRAQTARRSEFQSLGLFDQLVRSPGPSHSATVLVSYLLLGSIISTESSTPKLAQEEGCFGATFERKYYRRGNVFIKRSLRPLEYRTGHRGFHVPRLGTDRLKNEAECLQYIRQHTDIPVPTIYCPLEDDDAYYLITEYVEGVGMSDLQDNQKSHVQREIETHLDKLKSSTSYRLGGPSGIVIPPHRVFRQTEQDA